MEATIGKCMGVKDDLIKCGYDNYVPIKMWDLASIIDKRIGYTERTGFTTNAIKHVLTMMVYVGLLSEGGNGIYWMCE